MHFRQQYFTNSERSLITTDISRPPKTWISRFINRAFTAILFQVLFNVDQVTMKVHHSTIGYSSEVHMSFFAILHSKLMLMICLA